MNSNKHKSFKKKKSNLLQIMESGSEDEHEEEKAGSENEDGIQEDGIREMFGPRGESVSN